MISGRKHNYQAWLIPYAEGTLDAARTALLEAQMARDPALSAEAGQVRAVNAQLRRAAALNTSEGDPRLALAPAPLWPGVQKRLAHRPRRLPRPAQWAGGACAASLALCALLLYVSLPGIGTRQTPLPAPLRTATAGGAAAANASASARMRRKKTGRRPHARPMPLALRPPKLPMPAHLADRPPPLPSFSPAPALPALVPSSAAPSARAAVAWKDGSAQFRLASPVQDALPENSSRPASDTLADPAGANTPAPDKPAPPDTAPPRQADPDASASASIPSPAAAQEHARKTYRHHLSRRHYSRHPAAPNTAPVTGLPPAKPVAVPPESHAARAI